MPSPGTASFIPSADLAEASPNKMFMYFLFHRWDVYLDAMMNPNAVDVDTTTASLLATCTDPDKRKEFHDKYLSLRNDPTIGPVTASILVSGDFFAYVAEACEFVEKSYGASG